LTDGDKEDYITTARIKNSVRSKLAIIAEVTGKTYSDIIDESIKELYQVSVQGLAKRE
jgi:predicted transcriptional regulator